jgi:coenzyme F420-reducing hydrogenase gamma subunit
MECKRRGTVCLAVAEGVPCLGPVTHSGCGALCPSYRRGCFGCFGPVRGANTDSMSRVLRSQDQSDADLVRWFRTYNAGAEAFRKAGDAHERALR